MNSYPSRIRVICVIIDYPVINHKVKHTRQLNSSVSFMHSSIQALIHFHFTQWCVQANEEAHVAERMESGMAPSQVSAPTPARPSEPPVTSPHRQLPRSAYQLPAGPTDAADPSGNAEAKENEVHNFPRSDEFT